MADPYTRLEAVSKPTEARQYQSSGTTKSLKKRDFEIAKQRATLLLNASAEGFETDSKAGNVSWKQTPARFATTLERIAFGGS